MSNRLTNRQRLVHDCVMNGLDEDRAQMLTTHDLNIWMQRNSAAKSVDPGQPIPPPGISSEALNIGDGEETLVDFSHARDARNPSRLQYARFEQLTRMRLILNHAIRTNEGFLNNRAGRLDADDKAVLDKAVVVSKYKLELVTREMDEIHQYFLSVDSDVRTMYQQMNDETVDLNGDLQRHFQLKMNNIIQYRERMSQEVTSV